MNFLCVNLPGFANYFRQCFGNFLFRTARMDLPCIHSFSCRKMQTRAKHSKSVQKSACYGLISDCMGSKRSRIFLHYRRDFSFGCFAAMHTRLWFGTSEAEGLTAVSRFVLFFSTRLLSGLNISILLFSRRGFKKRVAIRIRCFAL